MSPPSTTQVQHWHGRHLFPANRVSNGGFKFHFSKASVDQMTVLFQASGHFRGAHCLHLQGKCIGTSGWSSDTEAANILVRQGSVRNFGQPQLQNAGIEERIVASQWESSFPKTATLSQATLVRDMKVMWWWLQADLCCLHLRYNRHDQNLSGDIATNVLLLYLASAYIDIILKHVLILVF